MNNKNHIIKYVLLFCLAYSLTIELKGQGSLNGLLRKSPNAIYFTDAGGNAILLTGSHTWANFQEIGIRGQENFDWQGYLDMMQQNHHNFMRLWVWEQCWGAPWTDDEILIDPLPYERVGQVNARDGKPQFDLTRWNQSYFDRLRSKVIEAGNRGIYVSIMLFQGWSLNKSITTKSDPYLGHPYNKSNNINRVSFPHSNSDDDAKPTLHSLKSPDIVALQEAYVKKVIETVNDLDNVLYEVINEGGGLAWQNHMADFVKTLEKSMSKQHPVGITHSVTPFVLNEALFQTDADWISPANEPAAWQFPGTVLLDNYMDNPPANHSNKVVIVDTDHIWGIGGDYTWAWKSFCRGLNPVFMDPWEPIAGKENKNNGTESYATGGIRVASRDYPDWKPLRKNLGVIHDLSSRIGLINMKPMDWLSSTQYCLANPGEEYVIFFPMGGNATINLYASTVAYDVSWYVPFLDQWIQGKDSLTGGSFTRISAPFTGAAVLYLKKKG